MEDDIFSKPHESYKEPSTITRLKALIDQANLSSQIQDQISVVLSDHSALIYGLREDNKRMIATVRAVKAQVQTESQLRAQMMERVGDLARQLEQLQRRVLDG